MTNQTPHPDEVRWEELHERMNKLVQPLIEAGWTIVEQFNEPSEDSCVVCNLRRGDASLSIDHYPDGWSDVWDQSEAPVGDEVAEPLTSDPDFDPASLEGFFRSYGLI